MQLSAQARVSSHKTMYGATSNDVPKVGGGLPSSDFPLCIDEILVKSSISKREHLMLLSVGAIGINLLDENVQNYYAFNKSLLNLECSYGFFQVLIPGLDSRLA
ncbi:MAG: hypothetical protein IT343_19725 [Candidatus Melainabacteria bacterium]|nr:hypothetical protein [Candidatus Melainabacteria bacterium]